MPGDHTLGGVKPLDSAKETPQPVKLEYVDTHGVFTISNNTPNGAIENLFNKNDPVGMDLSKTPSADWVYKVQVITLAKQAFGHFGQWLRSQTNRPYLYGRRFEFICDTLNFIATGKREMDIRNWVAILESTVAPRPDQVPNDAFQKFRMYELNLTSTSEIIAQWCAQPKGFDDMLCTLNILFGAMRAQPEDKKKDQ